MAMAQTAVVVAVFPEQAQAQHAVDELRRAGFSDDEIGFLTRVGVDTTDVDRGADAAAGAVGGGLVGGVVGAAVALLIPGIGPAIAGGILAATLGGAAVGAAAGGLIGAFTTIGVSDADARFYHNELAAGRSVVTVKGTTDLQVAEDILRRSGATDVRLHDGVINATPPQRPYGAPPETYDPTLDRDETNRPL